MAPVWAWVRGVWAALTGAAPPQVPGDLLGLGPSPWVPADPDLHWLWLLFRLAVLHAVWALVTCMHPLMLPSSLGLSGGLAPLAISHHVFPARHAWCRLPCACASRPCAVCARFRWLRLWLRALGVCRFPCGATLQPAFMAVSCCRCGWACNGIVVKKKKKHIC